MSLHSPIAELADKRITYLVQTQPKQLELWLETERNLLKRGIALSDFIYDSLNQDHNLLLWLHHHLQYLPRVAFYRAQLKQMLCSVCDEHALSIVLRKYRRQEMLWLAWQDFHNQIPLEASLSHLSHLAEAIVIEAYHWLYKKSCDEWGTPCNQKGTPQPMLILAMGKLGGGELNFSSDIDLIFTYPENGETRGAHRSIANAQFFTRLGQRLIKVIEQKNVEGFCYRVDMRLRPFGDSGPLVMSFAAFEEYYQEQGRDWERYAMIKARVLGKEQFACYQQFRQMLRPFVFRRYIDFSAIQSLRRMKGAIQTEVRRRGLQNNIKLGAGGIREIEFIAQSFQLIRGGRDSSLRQRGLVDTLEAIKTLQLLPTNEVKILANAYAYLRRIENLLQAINDKQTQTLPTDGLDQMRLVLVMKKATWQSLKDEVDEYMQSVNQIFANLIDDENEKLSSAPEYQEIWDSTQRSDMEKLLLELGCEEPRSIASVVVNFKEELTKRTIGPRGREVLQHLMPTVLLKVLSFSDEAELLARIFKLLNQILTRTAYLELLDENHGAIEQLVRLCAASSMVAQKLASFPMLLDELLDPVQLYNPTPVYDYRAILFEYLARIPKEDMEQQMEHIRHFKQTQLLRIAAADIAGALPVMKVSDHLTFLAEAIVDAIVNQAWEQMVQKYGKPAHVLDYPAKDKGFAVIAYGKLGGIELGYGSDLDVVFIHDCPDNCFTNGEMSINGRQFYLRLAQRIMHLFSTRTTFGVLYEIDTRLRPSGTSGMLVTTLNGFEQYQQNEAWIWEHQALVRARVIYGNEQLRQDFDAVRQTVLTKPRSVLPLKQKVVSMREKMRAHLGSKKQKIAGINKYFHLKQDQGGIVDIEFITQFLVLANAHQEPKLAFWSDNVRILDEVAKANILSNEQIQSLQNAYTTLRNEAHRLSLSNESPLVKDTLFSEERKRVIAIWQQCFA